jgi:predicted ABC-type ATPase
MKPRMIVVAGPSGSGKSALFPVQRFSPRGFNVDDRAAQIHGSYVGIPGVVRRQSQAECESFVAQEIQAMRDFAVETTLRSKAALVQAHEAQKNGFFTFLIFVCTESVDENIARVAARGAMGGHSAPAPELRDIYQKSLMNLASCRDLFNAADLYDTTVRWELPRHVGSLRDGIMRITNPIPAWLPETWRST